MTRKKVIAGLPPVAKRMRCAACRKAMRPTLGITEADHE